MSKVGITSATAPAKTDENNNEGEENGCLSNSDHSCSEDDAEKDKHSQDSQDEDGSKDNDQDTDDRIDKPLAYPLVNEQDEIDTENIATEENMDQDMKETDPDELEEQEEEEDNENLVEAKDFSYFKKQCKFEKFVSQLKEGTTALGSILGGETFQEEAEQESEDPKVEEEVVGFDTRFTYTREGLIVFDIHAHMKLDKYRKENNGITFQDYKVFMHAIPPSPHEKDNTNDNYQKFKSYSNALAPFAGLEFATEHERKIYEYLPPFTSTKQHEKTKDLLIPNTENILFFNSEFESGNLDKAIRISDFEYNLYLEFDKNSRNHTQWYYFSCRNIKRGITVKFNIINLLKVDSCYNEGMKP